MSEKKIVLKKYLVSRLGDCYVLMQRHPKSGKEICIMQKKSGAIDAQFMEAVQEQAANSKVRVNISSDSSLRLEAETEDHLDFLLKC